LLNTLREILALNNCIAIISSTQFPEIIPLVLESIGLKPYEIARIKFIFTSPTILATGALTAPVVKNQQLAIAQKIFPGLYFHNTDTMLIDYQQASAEAAISAGYRAVQAPSLHNFPIHEFERETHRRIHAFHPTGEGHLNDTRYLNEVQNMNKEVALTPKGFLGKNFILSRAHVLYSNHEKELLKALKGLLLRELEAYRAQILINPANSEFITDYNHTRGYYLEVLQMHRDFRRIVYGGKKPTTSMQIEEPAHQAFMLQLEALLNPIHSERITFSEFI